MTWPLSGWILSSSSSSSMEEDQDTNSDTATNDEDDEITLNDDHSFNVGINEQNVDIFCDKHAENDPYIPTAIAISGTGNAPSNIVTVAVPSNEPETGASDCTAQRRRATVWTYEDEIQLLRGFLEYTSENRINGGHRLHQQEAAAFYHMIKPKIQLSCDKNQLFEKLRRLKRKYLTIYSKIDFGEKPAFKTSHDQSTFEICRKIWSHNSDKTPKIDNISEEVVADINPNLRNIKVKRENLRDHEFDLRPSTKRRRTRLSFGEVSNSDEMSGRSSSVIDDFSKFSGVVEEVARGCLSPFFKELMSNGFPPPFYHVGKIKSSGGGEAGEERWRKQQEMEMEVYMKRLELVQDEIRVSLEELRSKGTRSQ